jgi:glycosyltransferase involved in cell wall biosynthesis
VTGGNRRLGMILKGYPRISESFISTEILLLESLGIPIDIYSLKQPREDFSHEHVKQIKAPTTYMPEYVLPHWRTLLTSNLALRKLLGTHYTQCLRGAVQRAWERKKAATLRHFLQAGHLASTRLLHNSVTHLHAHFCHTPASVALFASELTGLPFSFTAHAKDIYISEPEQLARKIKNARFVVTCTGYNARYLEGVAERGGCRHTPLHIVYHGIDLSLFSFAPTPIPGPPYRILSIGRLVAKKGYDTLLKSLKLLDRNGFDFRFTHIGSGELKPQITRMIHDLDLKERVRLLGTLPHKDAITHYRQAHCFALASRVAPNGDRDGIPNVLIEAMATGVPVVATKVSAIPELVENGVTGVMVPPDDPRSLAEAIGDILLQPDRYQGHILRARARVEKDFDNRRCVQQLHLLFRDALGAP